MNDKLNFEGTLSYALKSFLNGFNLLFAQKPPFLKNALTILGNAIYEGNTVLTGEIANQLLSEIPLDESNKKEVAFVAERFAAVIPGLRRDYVSEVELKDFAGLCLMAADLLQVLSILPFSYNLYELCYSVNKQIGISDYRAAENLLRLANKDKPDQYHSAIWRMAAAQVLQSLQKQDDWIKAIDAVELALTVRIENESFQDQLCEELMRAIGESKSSSARVLDSLLPSALLLSGYKKISPAGKTFVINQLLGLDGNENKSVPLSDELRMGQSSKAMEFYAVVKAQTYIDDQRIALQFPSERASLTWNDLALAHMNLNQAVPLMESLIVDKNRTGRFLLDLAHEITHAYSMIGAVGINRCALRVALHTCELLLTAPEAGSGLSDGLAQQVAAIRQSISYRSSVLEYLWMPWFEGLAMYVELLSDPKSDPNEILPVYEAIRSLIEINLPPHKNESAAEYAHRYEEETTRRFDDFYSGVIGSLSEERHIAYLELYRAPEYQKEIRDIYLLGYLLVRSVVSRWETTVGRALTPVIISKLLLYLTRYSTFDAIPDLIQDSGTLEEASKTLFNDWLKTIAGLSKEVIEEMIGGVGRNEKGAQYLWKNGIPHKVTNMQEGLRMEAELTDKLLKDIADLVKGKGFDRAKKEDRETEDLNDLVDYLTPVIKEVFSQYAEFRTLLPVGKDFCRILFTGVDNRIALCPRTFIGYSVQQENKSFPRYSVKGLRLKDRAEEERLRILCGRNGSARLLVTRVIDLQGHPDNPWKKANTSFVCFFLGEDWHKVSLSYSNNVDLDEKHKRWIDLLRARVLTPGSFSNEGETHAPGFNRILYARAVAIESCANGFKTEAGLLEKSLADLDDRTKRRELAKYLYDTASQKAHPRGKHLLADLTVTSAAYSGIIPFNL